MSKKVIDKLRGDYVAKVQKLLAESGEEILQVGSNEIAMPCVDEEGNEQFIVLTVKVPSGSRDGELYDGYAMAKDYEIKCQENQEKAKAKAEAKAKKIASDKAKREAKEKAKAERGEG